MQVSVSASMCMACSITIVHKRQYFVLVCVSVRMNVASFRNHYAKQASKRAHGKKVAAQIVHIYICHRETSMKSLKRTKIRMNGVAVVELVQFAIQCAPIIKIIANIIDWCH